MTIPASKLSDTRSSPLKRHAIALVLTGVLATAIAFLTLSPPMPVMPAGFLTDKAYHVIAFIAFTALAFPTALLYARSLVWVIPAALMFGGVIELLQPYVGRSREGADLFADVLGVCVGVALGLAIRSVLRRRRGMQGSVTSQL